MFLFTVLIHLAFNFAFSLYYDEENATNIFDYFKEKYNKKYKSSGDENNHLRIFVQNLNKVEQLNEVTKDKNMFFILNQYADLNVTEIDDHYAIKVQPYDNVSNTAEAQYLGRQIDKSLNTSELYNLDEASELYEEFLKTHKKERKRKLNKTIHYYRFVKTLVEMNRNHMEGNDKVIVDSTADELKEPNEYTY